MNRLATIASILIAVAPPSIDYFHYQRPIPGVPPAGQACVVLDPQLFSRATPGLADLRLYRDGSDAAYAIHLAAPAPGGEKQIAPLNLGKRGGQTVFDAAMPADRYSDVLLAVSAQNFIAAVTVSGSQAETGAAETRLGAFTIFDLTRQKLGRSTVLHLPDSDFRFLHFRIAGPIEPESITGISVERLPSSPPRYITVAESAQASRQGRTSVFEFNVPAHVPVDRIEFAPSTEPVNFTRDVSVSVLPIVEHPPNDAEPVATTAFGGNLLRVRSVQEGRRIEEQRLTIDASGPALESAATWKVIVDNGDDPPLHFDSVRMEMIERDLCFDAAAGSYALYYGDPALTAPSYDYARLFAFDPHAARLTLAPEQPNAAWRPRPDARPFTERHPALLWVALVLVVVVLGAIALRSARTTSQPTA
jgi:hypothetical protein